MPSGTRLAIIGAGGPHKTEAAIARAAEGLGHPVRVFDATSLRARRLPAWFERQVHAFEPDFILFTARAHSLGPARIRALAARQPATFWYFDVTDPPEPRAVELGRAVGRMFVVSPDEIHRYETLGVERVSFLPQGVDPADLPATRVPARYRCAVSFVGSGAHPHRHAALRAVQARAPLQIRGPGWDRGTGLPVEGGEIRGRGFAQVVAGAAVNLGGHSFAIQRERRLYSSNRLWKVLSCGGFYLGERSPDVDELARGGVHCAWYASPEEAADLAVHYLERPLERAALASAGRDHALAHHTYAHRIPLLLADQGYTSR